MTKQRTPCKLCNKLISHGFNESFFQSLTCFECVTQDSYVFALNTKRRAELFEALKKYPTRSTRQMTKIKCLIDWFEGTNK